MRLMENFERMEEVLIQVEEMYGIIIEDCSREFDDCYVINFDVKNRSLNLGIEIQYSGITGREQFVVNFPSYTLKFEELQSFVDELNIAEHVISILNNAINTLYKK